MSFSPILDSSFSTFLSTLVWVLLPLYAACIGVALTFGDKVPSTASHKNWAHEVAPSSPTLPWQLAFYFCALFLMASYRGYEGPFFQGQLLLTGASTKVLFCTLTLLGLAGLVSLIFQTLNKRPSPLGVSIWALGPVMAALWGLLPLMTQLTSALLILELISVALIWAVTAAPSVGAGSEVSPASAMPGFVHALIIFIWASGLSALTLLLGLGLTTLEGSSLNFTSAASFNGGGVPSARLNEALFVFVLLFKFLMGSGQFLLLTWYRFLPTDALTFYLFYYYPAQLLIGTTFFIGFFISAAATSLAILLTILFIAAVSLMSTLGAQTSPALTLAGSSFVGLTFVALALLNLGV